MHPNNEFTWSDRSEMADFINTISFCTIFVPGPLALHTPAIAAPNSIRFHVARNNRATASLNVARALISSIGENGYVSPDWCSGSDPLPTWNYVAVEAVGRLRPLARDAFVEFLDILSAGHESRLAPKLAWTRAKMTKGLFNPPLENIMGFELEVEEMHGTRKLGQH